MGDSARSASRYDPPPSTNPCRGRRSSDGKTRGIERPLLPGAPVPVGWRLLDKPALRLPPEPKDEVPHGQVLLPPLLAPLSLLFVGGGSTGGLVPATAGDGGDANQLMG